MYNKIHMRSFFSKMDLIKDFKNFRKEKELQQSKINKYFLLILIKLNYFYKNEQLRDFLTKH